MTKSHVLLTKSGFYCVLFLCLYPVFVLWVLGLAISYFNNEAAEVVLNVTVLLYLYIYIYYFLQFLHYVCKWFSAGVSALHTFVF